MFSVISEDYQYYLLFLPVFFASSVILPVSSLGVLAVGLFLFFIRERTELVIATFIIIIVMGDNLWDAFAIFKISRIVILLFTVVMSGLIMVNKEEGIDTRVSYFLPFWLVTLISSLWFSNSYGDSITRVFSYLFLVVSVFTFFRYVYNQKRVGLVEHIFTITGLIVFISLLGMFSPVSSWFYFSGRFMGIFGNPNTMSLFIIMMYPMIDNIDFEDTRISKRAKVVLLVLLIISMLLTGSRNGFISLSIYIMGKIFLTRGVSGKTIIIAGAFVALLVLLNYQTISSYIPFVKDFARVNSLESSTASGRTIVWGVAVEQIKSAPWLGRGLTFTGKFFNNFKEQHGLIGRFWNSVWNSYLAILLETGIMGLATYFFFLFGLVKKAMNIKLIYVFLLSAFFSAIFESWMISSLNVCTALFLFNFIIISGKE